MKQQKDAQKTKIPQKNRIAEISEILLNGIRRLEAKERSQNLHLLVDSNYSRSLHSVDSNLNQQVTHYE